MNYADILVATVIALGIFAAIVFLASRACEARGNSSPMSDDEFMSSLPPGTSRGTALRVRAIVAKHTGVPPEQIHPETKFVDL